MPALIKYEVVFLAVLFNTGNLCNVTGKVRKTENVFMRMVILQNVKALAAFPVNALDIIHIITK